MLVGMLSELPATYFVPASFIASCIIYELDDTSSASSAVIGTDPVLFHHELLLAVPATLIGWSFSVLLFGVITPSINAPMTVAPLTTDPITIGWLIDPIWSSVTLPVLILRSTPAMA